MKTQRQAAIEAYNKLKENVLAIGEEQFAVEMFALGAQWMFGQAQAVHFKGYRDGRLDAEKKIVHEVVLKEAGK